MQIIKPKNKLTALSKLNKAFPKKMNPKTGSSSNFYLFLSIAKKDDVTYIKQHKINKKAKTKSS